MEPTATLARRFWEAIEPILAIAYFAPEPAEAGRPHVQLGVSAFWWPSYLIVRGRHRAAGLGA